MHLADALIQANFTILYFIFNLIKLYNYLFIFIFIFILVLLLLHF